MKKYHFYIIFLFAIVNTLFAQTPIHFNLKENQGLPDVEFYDIMEDGDNFIWLAADKGLYRFDGENYLNYSHKDKRGLSVFGLKFDEKKRIWCNNISGQFFFVENDKLRLFIDLKDKLRGELADFVFLNNKMLVFTRTTLYLIDLKTKKTDVIKAGFYEKDHYFGGPSKFDNRIYFLIKNRIYYLDEKLKVIAANGYSNNDCTNFISKFFKYKKTKILYVYEVFKNKSLLYQFQNGKVTTLKIPAELEDSRIISFLEKEGKIWFSTTKGAYQLTLDSKNELHISDSFFKDDIITKTLVDYNENYWFTTLANGVYVVPNTNIKNYDLNNNNATISCVKIVNDNIVYGTTKGELVFLNNKKQVIEKIQLKEKLKITALAFNSNTDFLYISTENSSYIYSLKSKKLSSSKDFVNIKKLNFDERTNKIMLASFNKASILEFDHFILRNQKLLDSKRAYAIFNNEFKNELYVAYVDEFVAYDSLFNARKIKLRKASITAIDITQTKNEIIWIATFNNGLIGLKPDNTLLKIQAKNGLLSNLTERIKSDGNLVWIITDKGIQLLNTEDLSIKTIALKSNSFFKTIIDILILKNSILFVSQNEIFEIKKGVQLSKNYKSNLYISKISINEKGVTVQNNFSLPYDKNRISFSFHTNGFFPNEKLEYEYRLKGLNDEWITIENNLNIIKFNSLPSGKYIFEVRIKETKELKKSHFASIAFEIKKPFWEQWWFILSVLVFAFAAIILFYRKKLAAKEQETQNALKNAEYENRLIALKLENLKSQMNPHFIFNALNSIQEYIILNQKNLASNYLAKFADLIRAYLEHSSKGEITLKEEIDCLNIYLELEKLRFEEKLIYQIKTNDTIDVYDLKIPTMLIQPYVENALKHGLLHKKENRILNINFSLKDDGTIIECIIEDNGVGREKSAFLNKNRHKSFASEATENRLKLLNFKETNKIGVRIDDLFDSAKNPIGTKVTVTIPTIL